MSKKLFIYGHRGAKGLKTENTLASMEHAVSLGVDGIEFDCQPCLDADVVFHDRSITQAGQCLPIASIARRELQGYLGSEELFPTLKQVLPYALRVDLNLEWKCDSVSSGAQRTIEAFLSAHPEAIAHLLFSSFNHPLLLECRRIFPAVRRAPIFYGAPLSLNAIIDELAPASLHFSKDFLTDDTIGIAKDRSCLANVYTVNTPAEAELLRERGVNGIFTDYPDRFV